MGFRLDAIKHMDRRFLLTFVSRVVPIAARPELKLLL